MTSPLMNNYGPPARTFVSGSGIVLVDVDGNEYLDLLCGLAVTSLGHAHPKVSAAICAQAQTLSHTSNLFANTLAPGVASTIDRLIGGGGKVFFANSGAEANECAIKLARRFQGDERSTIVSTVNSFHGRTYGALAATGQLAKHVGFAPMPGGFAYVPYNDLEAVRARLANGDVAAVIVEPVQAEGGIIPADPGYLAGVRDLATKAGALVIIDEIQTGLGRCGAWFAHHLDEIDADIVTVAKSLGNGMPIGACWARDEVAAAFVPGDHGTTFGGQPLALSAAAATLAELEALNAPAVARQLGDHLSARLQEVPGVIEVRGRGLLLAAVVAPGSASAVVAAGLSHGIVTNAVRPDAVRFAPPFIASTDDLDLGVARFAAALEDCR